MHGIQHVAENQPTARRMEIHAGTPQGTQTPGIRMRALRHADGKRQAIPPQTPDQFVVPGDVVPLAVCADVRPDDEAVVLDAGSLCPKFVGVWDEQV